MSVDWKQVANLAELGAGVALNVLGAEGIVPTNAVVLAQGIEAAVNPLLSSVQTGKQPTSTVILAGYGAMIGSLNAVKQATGLAPDLIQKIDEYLAAAQAGTTAYL